MFVELPRVRLDGGARAFRQHWGYESRPLAPPPPLIEEDEAAVEPETVSLREANTASPIGESMKRTLKIDLGLSGDLYIVFLRRYNYFDTLSLSLSLTFTCYNIKVRRS